LEIRIGGNDMNYLSLVNVGLSLIVIGLQLQILVNLRRQRKLILKGQELIDKLIVMMREPI
jgi:hypothetical protein